MLSQQSSGFRLRDLTLHLTLVVVCVWLALLGGNPAFAGESKVQELTLEQLRTKYDQADSRYITLDGVNLHYQDRGTGPAIVFLHASYLNLFSWDGLIRELEEDFRTVSFDFPGAGLSTLESKSVPEGGFNMVERQYELLVQFIDALEIDRLVLVGTSSGGSVAYRYAARNSERVERLILINSAGMPRTAQTNPLRAKPEFKKWAAMNVKPREFWATSLNNNFISPHTPPDWLIDQAYDFQRREGLNAERAKTYKFSTGDVKTVLGQIRSPTLIMWGHENPTVMHLEADVIEHWLTGAPSLLRKYQSLGHYPYIEKLDAVLPDFKAFLNGELDDELRQTLRVPVQQAR